MARVRYELIILRRAEFELYQNALWWAEHRSLDQAVRWLEGFEVAIFGLSENPERHGPIREQHLFDFRVQELLYGVGKKLAHCAVFRVRGDRIYVYTI